MVSKDSVRITLIISELNDLDVLACDIQNAYLTEDYRERVWVIDGTEFGSEDGTDMLARKAQDDDSTKEKGDTEKNYILRGELEYAVFLP